MFGAEVGGRRRSGHAAQAGQGHQPPRVFAADADLFVGAADQAVVAPAALAFAGGGGQEAALDAAVDLAQDLVGGVAAVVVQGDFEGVVAAALGSAKRPPVPVQRYSIGSSSGSEAIAYTLMS